MRGLKRYKRILLTALIAMACALLLAGLASRVGKKASAGQAEILKQAITRAAVTCYAIEGRYPANLQYMIDNYGVAVDSSAYVVSYDAYADNLLPDIRVYEREVG